MNSKEHEITKLQNKKLFSMFKIIFVINNTIHLSFKFYNDFDFYSEIFNFEKV